MSESHDRPAPPRERMERMEALVLRERVERLETLILRAAALGAIVAIVLGFFVPFLTTTGRDDTTESIRLLPAVFAAQEAGQGPFRSAAVLTSVVIGLFALVAAATVIALLAFHRSPTGRRHRIAVQTLSTILLVQCCGAWLLVLVLSGRADGEVSAFSPAVAWLTVGSVVGIASRYLIPSEDY